MTQGTLDIDAVSQNFPKIPLVLGVTGHRLLRQGEADQARLKELIRQVFDEFRNRYPHTPFILLSPLSKGADRLAAWVALEEPYKKWFTVVVPMPFPEPEYREDFKKDGSEPEFDQLLQAAGIETGKVTGRLFPMPVPAGANLKDHKRRDFQYALVGEYTVQFSQALLAFWDGKISDDPDACGSSAVVKFKLEGISTKISRQVGEPWLPPVRPLEIPQTGPVYHIRAPREGETIAVDEIKLVKLFPGVPGEGQEQGLESWKQQDRFFNQTHGRIDGYNALIGEADGSVAGKVQAKEHGRLLPDDALATLPAAPKALHTFYVFSDALAKRFQERTRVALLGMCLLVCLAAGLLALQFNHLIEDKVMYIFLCLDALCVTAGVGWWYVSIRNDWQDKYQDYRALAEGLRVQFFWWTAGLKASVSNHYLLKQSSELEWIRYAISNCCLVSLFAGTNRVDDPFTELNAARTQERQNLVSRFWVERQADYFKRSEERDEEELLNYKNAGGGLIIFSLMLTFGLKALVNPGPIPATPLIKVAVGISVLVSVAAFLTGLFHRLRRRGKQTGKPAAGIWRGCIGLLVGTIIFGVQFDLSATFPRVFAPWSAIAPVIPRVFLLCAAVLLSLDGATRLFTRRKKMAELCGRDLVLGAEDLILQCWHGLVGIAALFFLLFVDRADATIAQAYVYARGVKPDDYHTYLFLSAIAITATLGGLLNYYAEKRALEAHVREYARMKLVFQRVAAGLKDRLFQPGEPEDPLKDLGQEALLENSTWLMAHRERPMELPKPGH